MLSLRFGLIVPSLVDGEQHGAFEAVALGQDLGELRQRLLGAVLLVAADEDDVLALAGAVAALEDDPRVGRALREAPEARQADGQGRCGRCREHGHGFTLAVSFAWSSSGGRTRIITRPRRT